MKPEYPSFIHLFRQQPEYRMPLYSYLLHMQPDACFTLRGLFADLAERLRADGDYGADVVGEAFIRSHEEPGRAWNMDEWNARHRSRKVVDDGAR